MSTTQLPFDTARVVKVKVELPQWRRIVGYDVTKLAAVSDEVLIQQRYAAQRELQRVVPRYLNVTVELMVKDPDSPYPTCVPERKRGWAWSKYVNALNWIVRAVNTILAEREAEALHAEADQVAIEAERESADE